MITVSLTTDWGLTGCYAGLFKAKLVQRIPGIQIVDITHSIPPYAIDEAVFALRPVYPNFSTKAIHVVSVASIDVEAEKNREFICFRHNHQYFIGPNNGLWHRLLPDVPEEVFLLDNPKKHPNGSFSEVDLFVSAIAKLSMGETPERIGSPIKIHPGFVMPAPSVDEDKIIGNFLYFDVYGNGVTNISKEYFERIGKGRLFSITAGRLLNKTNVLSEDYESLTDNNKIIALFNTSGYLELSLPFHSLKTYGSFDTKTRIMVQFFETAEDQEKGFVLC